MATHATKARPWPNYAKEQRDGAAEKAVHAIKELDQLFEDRPMLHAEILLHVSRAKSDLLEILRQLEAVGACTRP